MTAKGGEQRWTGMPWLLAWLMMGLVAFGLYPFYQYYIDPDATAYLSISEAYARGDWQRAVNGYWSPWACWGTAMGIRWGASPFFSALVFNFIGASGFLAISLHLARYFGVSYYRRLGMGLCLALFLVYAIYKQSFDDLWAFTFLLVALRMLVSTAYQRSLIWAGLLGLVGALAYLAKAYAFPFFVFQLLCFHLMDGPWGRGPFRWRPFAMTLTCLVLASLPWVYALWVKYGFWTLGTAGSLNRAWFLLGSPLWKDAEAVFLPPPYADSPYYWEDPFLVNGDRPAFWQGGKYLILQLIRIGWNSILFVQSTSALSFLFLPLWLWTWALAGTWGRRHGFPIALRKLGLSLLLFPLAYFLINFESRYLWYMVPGILILGLRAIDSLGRWLPNRWWKEGLTAMFLLSFLVHPLWDMHRLFEVGKSDYEIAQLLKRKGIQGKFTHMEPRENVPSLARVAYFSGNPMYLIQPPTPSWDRLMTAMESEQIFYFYHMGPPIPFEIVGERGLDFQEVTGGEIPGFHVWRITRNRGDASPPPRLGD